MEIAFLSFYSGVNYRGVETYVHELSNQLVQLGHSVCVYQSGPKFASALYETGQLSSVGSLPVFIRSPHILIATNGRLQSLLARVWCLTHHAKLLIPGQSGPGRDDLINLYVFPDVFIALTTVQKNWAKKYNPFVKVVSIPNGVDTTKFTSAPKRPKNAFLSVAALVPEKRLHLAINAVANIHNAHLTLVGSGPEKEKLLALGNKHMPGRLKITSSRPENMPSVYTSASTFIYPTSPFESFGIVLVEAMAANLPIVATADPIRQEIIGPAGLFVDPEDTTLFTKALEQAENKNWAHIPRIQAEKFTWSKIAQDYDHLFKELK